MNKIVVYTAITGGYDTLKKHKNSSNPNIDFVCFTDNQNLVYNDNGWIIKPIPKDLLKLSDVKKQRMLKILPHKYLSEYDISLWVDANINILCDVNDFLNTLDFNKYHFFSRKHPRRNCIYDEGPAVVSCHKDTQQSVDEQLTGYRKEGFPAKYGLIESNMLARKHNEEDCKLLDEKWARELILKSHRDQLSFDYARWVTKVEIGYFDIGRMKSNDKFRSENHIKNLRK